MVFDTMVAAYALLGVESRREEAWEALRTADEILVPDVFWTELGSVVSHWLASRSLELEHALEVLRDAESLVTDVVPTVRIFEPALELALKRELPFHDALFAAVAETRATRVLSYDPRLRAAFDGLVLTPAEFLAERGGSAG